MDELGYEDGDLSPLGEFVGLLFFGLPSLFLIAGWLGAA